MARQVSYDIIGDIHGCADSLMALLAKLGYQREDQVYRHPSRQAIFLGDFIDRGPAQRKVIDIVQPMIKNGAALSVMGNHEFNAIGYATQDDAGRYLREHSDKNTRQHQAFLKAYPPSGVEYKHVIAWFQTLPLWLDLGDLRIVHACWDSRCIDRVLHFQSGKSRLDNALLEMASRKDTWQFEAVETLLKGKEIPLNNGASFRDQDGHVRHHIRIRWWDQQARTYRGAFMGPESARTHIPDDEIEGDHLVEYSGTEPPVFLGHYWLDGQPQLLAPNIACVDYSVAKPGGKLVAYQWDGEQTLTPNKFVLVNRVEPDGVGPQIGPLGL